MVSDLPGTGSVTSECGHVEPVSRVSFADGLRPLLGFYDCPLWVGLRRRLAGFVAFCPE